MGANDCLVQTASKLLNNLAKGIPEQLFKINFVLKITIVFLPGEPRINLASYDPLHIPRMTLKQGANSPVNIESNFINVDLYGLSDHVFTKMRYYKI